jgi:hypothetical protein
MTFLGNLRSSSFRSTDSWSENSRFFWNTGTFLPDYKVSLGRDSAVGIATRYRINGLGIESRWGRIFLGSSRPALGLIQPPIHWYWVFLGGKAAGMWCLPPTPSSAEVKERVELYLYSLSGPSWSVLGWNLPLPLPLPLPTQSHSPEDRDIYTSCSQNLKSQTIYSFDIISL